MKDTDKISKEQKRRNVVLASEIRESMRLTEEMLKAGQEALFDVAPDWTMQEREDLARAVFESMRSARAQPAAQPPIELLRAERAVGYREGYEAAIAARMLYERQNAT